jgi:hypothetical protein
LKDYIARYKEIGMLKTDEEVNDLKDLMTARHLV